MSLVPDTWHRAGSQSLLTDGKIIEIAGDGELESEQGRGHVVSVRTELGGQGRISKWTCTKFKNLC